MNILSYIEDKNILAYCYDNRDYEIISQHIDLIKNSAAFYFEKDGSIFGYDIKRINQLSNIYGCDCFAVNFFFKNICHSFNEKHNELMNKMVTQLNEDLDKRSGYYIIKVPSSNNMLINQLNILCKKYIFAGGTVCYYTKSIEKKIFKKDDLNIKIASASDKIKFKDKLLNLSEKSFKDYFGQYHISHLTREKAPTIYRNWIEGYIGDDEQKHLTIARIGDKIVGFIAFDETPYTYEMVLNCVDENYRGLKIYERMLRECVELCLKKNKLVTISTQLDNFLPQRVWVNSQFKPYNSFYLFHYNNFN